MNNLAEDRPLSYFIQFLIEIIQQEKELRKFKYLSNEYPSEVPIKTMGNQIYHFAVFAKSHTGIYF
ncbi:MAG: hypothetical protein OXE41_07795 [Gammaproteobacteria bacterium]|nr:hypothetical protein [Gammaproteobacteria bacterium]MCY4218777.1 hypothetical protein [Gammaproteobacteria bacterium]MCY4275279.1 hypothetical protein [Gammaproteobacteria bacterium]